MPSDGSSGELSLPQERIIYGFDEAANGLASGTISRGQALKLTGSALLGGGLLALFPKAASAQQQQCANKPAVNNNTCPPLRRRRCGLSNDCTCATTVKGIKTCVSFKKGCPKRDECDSTRDCPHGKVCVKVGGCCGHRGRNTCAKKC